MSLKTLLVCVQALMIQSISGQCIGAAPLLAAPCAAASLLGAPCAGAWGVGPAGLAASNGPGLAVSSASPLIPAGVSVMSENAYEGTLAAGGVVPFLGTVALEGVLLTAGAGAIAYGCGNGAVAITAEDIGADGLAGVAGPLGIAGPIGIAGPLGLAGPVGLAGPLGITGAGCGCGLIL
ncbi:chorion class B protein PC401-like [Epargyreus clarus]|uniref:chorion class B protein PC401-like n=1 Tax=Epargyreus clarus TaxID=520877 RepID=UPI003C2DBD11